MQPSSLLLILIGVVLAAAVVAVGAARSSRFAVPVLAGSVAASGAVWIIGFLLIRRGWRDVDGWVDCNRYCHGWHYLGAVLFYGPPLFVVALGVVWALVRRRSRTMRPQLRP